MFRLPFTIFAFLLLLLGNANALTLKTGQVLGSDGNVHDGASPEMVASIVASGDTAGVRNGNLFIVIEGNVTFVPVSSIAGMTKEGIKQVIVDAVIAGGELIDLTDARDTQQLEAQAENMQETATQILTAEALEKALESGSQEAIEQATAAALESGVLQEVVRDAAEVAAAEAVGNAIDAIEEATSSEQFNAAVDDLVAANNDYCALNPDDYGCQQAAAEGN